MFNNVIFLICLSIIFVFCYKVPRSSSNAFHDPRLSSVYDAMKSNFQQSIRTDLNEKNALTDQRNKRNINEKYDLKSPIIDNYQSAQE